ncbi:MAG: C1 family peptidase [Prevotellaceae bacterium]|jgi:bleomycin hydrolase|nr:C1 family peptidase [Prevotellaceae bacterium]
MKRLTFLVCALLLTLGGIQAQKKQVDSKVDNDIYKFTMVNDLPATPIKNQSRSGTCWCYSTIAFLEAELLRTGKGEYDLAEMYVVRKNFEDKAEKYVRMHGQMTFSPGALFENALRTIRLYGLIPEEAYAGLNYGHDSHMHAELDAITEAYINAVIKNKKLTTAWKDGYSNILDAYLGKVPEKFTYKGVEYTPRNFMDMLGINVDDYVSITSFTHHPFYSKFVLEVPDNYFWGESYNVPLDEFIRIVNSSIEQGYTVGWDSDVSEKGFRHRDGYAVIPDKDDDLDQTSSDRARWEAESGNNKNKKKEEPKLEPIKEKVITQKLRQQLFDSYETVDDHLMLITGIAKDQNGNIFYKVKNSWGTDNSRYDGYLFASTPYVQCKTISILINKNAIPSDIRSKLGL